MDDPQNQPGTGWTFPKVLGLLVGLIGMVGFGVCSLCGLAIGVQGRGLIGVVAIFAVPGLVLAALCFLLVRKMVRSARKSPSWLP